MRYILNLFMMCIYRLRYRSKVQVDDISKTHQLPKIEADGGEIHIGKGFISNNMCYLKTENNGCISIGNDVFMNHNCVVTSMLEISIGNNVKIGPNVMIFDHDHDYKAEFGISENKYMCSVIEIGDDCWIGAGAIILRGSKIGNGCVIGAGTVIKGNIESGTIIYDKRELVCLTEVRKK